MSNTGAWWEIPEDEKDKKEEPEVKPRVMHLCKECILSTSTFAVAANKIYCCWIGKDIYPFSEDSDHKCDQWRTKSMFKK